MLLTEKDLELICCAIMVYKVNGKYDMRLSQISQAIFEEFVANKRVVIEIAPEKT